MSTTITEPVRSEPLETSELRGAVEHALESTPVLDVHTHLFMPSLGALGLWGIDNLLTYHYLEAELFRSSKLKPEEYFALSLRGKADAIWQALFVDNAPVSEATRGVIAVLKAFDLPTDSADLNEARAFFAAQKLESHIDNVYKLSGVSEAVMTNDPLDPEESPLWLQGKHSHPKFHAALRLDRVLKGWKDNWQKLASQGYKVDENITGRSADEVRRFLGDWVARMRPVYMAVSLPDSFQSPAPGPCDKLLREAVLPACRDAGIPVSLMIGVRLQVNPALRLAGDAVGRADMKALENLLRDFPKNRFLVSVLSRENQHELAVYARKFPNLMPFGCWWFMNNPSIVEEITRERLEMLGTSFIPQHSDARILEQLVYKWRNTRRTLGPILTNAYRLLAEDGRRVGRAEIQKDVTRLFRTNFESWVARR